MVTVRIDEVAPEGHQAAVASVAPERSGTRSGHVLIVVQNLPVPFDRRVWLECKALKAAGYAVSVVCPRGTGDPAEQVIDGITLYKYRAPRTGSGALAYGWEYLYSFFATARLTLRAWRRERFDVLQACNPPDIFWPIALALRPFGVTFVFDHHDLSPELYESKFGTGRSFAHAALRFLEWCTFRSARQVISTNESYRTIAITRGKKRPEDVTVVRTGPDPDRMHAGQPCPELRRGRRHLAVYLGVMGPQDGVDLAIRAAHHLVHEMGRTDIAFTFIGSGESYDDLVALRDRLGLEEWVELPGRLPDHDVARLFSTAAVGLCPDPKNPLNDVSTMNKTMEYMAYGLPVVAFDLHETRHSAADAAAYAVPNDVVRFATAVANLLDDEPRRRAMGAFARRRVVDVLSWPHQEQSYLGVYARVMPTRSATASPAIRQPAS